MKLSEMTTKQFASAVCSMAIPMQNIAKDEEINRAFSAISGKGESGSDMTVLQKGGLLLELVPLLLEKRFYDTVSIISVMTGKSVKEVEAQNGMQTLKDIRSFWDDDFACFFGRSADTVRSA